MSLAQQLDALRDQFSRTAPEGRVALYESGIAAMRANFPLEQVRRTGDTAPDFCLPDAQGRQRSLSSLLAQGPVVLSFYRGGWCPYCNLQLRAYQQALADMQALGAQLVAVSPQSPDASLSTSAKNALAFDVLSDSGNHVARAFGLVYTLPEELQMVLRANAKALPDFNGDDSWELPLTATYVIAEDGTITLDYLDVDYRKRLETEEILGALRALREAP
jgi:peroxiredoxin